MRPLRAADPADRRDLAGRRNHLTVDRQHWNYFRPIEINITVNLVDAGERPSWISLLRRGLRHHAIVKSGLKCPWQHRCILKVEAALIEQHIKVAGTKVGNGALWAINLARRAERGIVAKQAPDELRGALGIGIRSVRLADRTDEFRQVLN